MGCNQSKDDALAAEFFGKDTSQSDGDNGVKETVRTTNVTSKPKVQQPTGKVKKSNFVAPPSSESFMTTAAPAPPEPRKVFSPPPTIPTINESKVISPAPATPRSVPDQAQPPVLTPVPPSGAKKTKPKSKNRTVKTAPSFAWSEASSQPQSAPRKLNDDDFSVAPSLEVAMRSIVAHKFTDVYQKGKKVRLLVFWRERITDSVHTMQS